MALDVFAWLVESFAERRDLAAARLILPTPEFFPHPRRKGRDLAERLFADVQNYCGFAGSRFLLTEDDSVPLERGPPTIGSVVHGRHAVGTYGRSRWNVPEITYATHLLDDPQALVATFADELAHHLLNGGAATPPPIDDDELEFLTDVAAVYLGFGVFLANSAFAFQQFSDGAIQGWQSSRQGYLPEPDLVFDTALFIAVKQLDPAPALQHLKPHLAKLLRRALEDLDPYGDRIDAIRALLPGDRSGQSVARRG